MIRHYDPRLARMFAGPGPHYGMERILFEEVRAKHGYSVKELERELKKRGVKKLPRAGRPAHDPRHARGQGRHAGPDPRLRPGPRAASRYAEDIWNEQDPARMPTRRAILERDDYRCMVPGCHCRAMIEGNHIDPKGRGGSNEQWNIHSLCHFHHRLFHEGYLRITGEAPDKVRFEFCPEPDGPPILVTIGHLIVEMDGRSFP